MDLEFTAVPPVLREGLALVEKGRLEAAQRVFVPYLQDHPESPLALSYCGLLTVLLDRRVQDGLNLCKAALRLAPNEQLCYLNLAKVHFAIGDRRGCVQNLHLGLRLRGERQELLMRFFRVIGFRRNPVLSFLHRDHFLNKQLGKLTWRLKSKKLTEAARAALHWPKR